MEENRKRETWTSPSPDGDAETRDRNRSGSGPLCTSPLFKNEWMYGKRTCEKEQGSMNSTRTGKNSEGPDQHGRKSNGRGRQERIGSALSDREGRERRAKHAGILGHKG